MRTISELRKIIVKYHAKCCANSCIKTYGEDFGEIFCYHIHVLNLDFKKLAKYFNITLTELAEVTADHIKRL